MLRNKRVLFVGEHPDSGMLHVYDATCEEVLNEALARLVKNAETTGRTVFVEGHLIGLPRTQTTSEFSADIGANQQEPAGVLHQVIADNADAATTTQPDSDTPQGRVDAENPAPGDETENPV